MHHQQTNGSIGQCFEIMGVDIMVDSTLHMHLIEVNHLTSWGMDSHLDDLIKTQVITWSLMAINITSSDKKHFESAGKKQSRIHLRN